MPIKAVFTDMDGTLLNPNHRISGYTANILRGLKDKGIHLIVTTGRPYADVFATISKCRLEPDFIITSNGGRIHDGSLNVVRECNIRPELVAKIAQLRGVWNEKTGAVEKKFATNIYREAEWLTDKYVPQAKAAFNDEFPCNALGEKFYELQAQDLKGVHEAWFLGHHHDLEPLYTYLKTTFSGELCCTYSLPYLIDCVPVGVTKGNSIREVAEMLNVQLEDVACFGDGMNDESMLQIAGKAYIMENGQQGLKDAVPHAEVIDSNANDGVARKLEELFFSN
ncbi:putative haloacid dehalogenase-like hydrolase [Leptomonas pyrrhocoris]|uniref:Putative haloacid dehalogenase-like hydrolase n=1 Tax=Leptomonas pyrrhocoris TaxID=157538 RepID=A0A0M9G9F8_LEPPY|nr:putative haloacid dehalogenase-like hydrolase [Leptomonas pyrrhocoris]XP_015663796.1 putative haloacid dehalogenase-like hydrolase [Leptomonas pyrrhocoris]XP_015663797.1 putative haloacid dehalogenase-like hydrolase [Leptomonas pyrrhocoris]KPA85356.1 putative haloacid dehalogenase-like hydrolase [Leptomonas pyrrhocoris]KPA85357.1 putative haloacid dehalogenase-like hydrolase [Leptomonas pyrrhocoris]KPA85358.1 putative haloacid dehalogenase-like hydrolase [Leptomonas pyrrhocoris]|eukprot:XP_015663795.1 putative haloacid dehalogenase-like hydrolase [Leptomonas pyrrhocoris]